MSSVSIKDKLFLVKSTYARKDYRCLAGEGSAFNMDSAGLAGEGRAFKMDSAGL